MAEADSPPRARQLYWMQAAGCGGCTMSALGAQAPDLLTALAIANIELIHHPALSEGRVHDHALLDALIAGDEPLDILCIEGAVVRGPEGTGRYHLIAGSDRTGQEVIRALAQVARHVVAVGSCSAFGGISAGGGNAIDACGLAYDGDQPGGLLPADFRARGGLPVVNIAGCPIHPGWLTETLHLLAMDALTPADLDEWQRPAFYTRHLVHHGCARNEYYEYKASADGPAELGCLMENLGCKGTQARADCNIRPWNGTGSCLSGHSPCINCTAPGFEEPGHAFARTPKVAGIPTGLPTDMPKAWFVALASLSKAATPPRLRANANADHIVRTPRDRRRGEP